MSYFQTLTVETGQTISDILELNSNLFSQNVAGLIVPANLTSTSISFQVSHDNATFVQLRDSTNAPIAITVSNSAAAYPIFDVRAFRFMKLVCGSAEAAQRLFRVILHRL